MTKANQGANVLEVPPVITTQLNRSPLSLYAPEPLNTFSVSLLTPTVIPRHPSGYSTHIWPPAPQALRSAATQGWHCYSEQFLALDMLNDQRPHIRSQWVIDALRTRRIPGNKTNKASMNATFSRMKSAGMVEEFKTKHRLTVAFLADWASQQVALPLLNKKPLLMLVSRGFYFHAIGQLLWPNLLTLTEVAINFAHLQ